MTDVEALRGELENLSRRVVRLERRLDFLEPETAPGVGRESVPEAYEPSESPILDAIGEAIGALGGFARED